MNLIKKTINDLFKKVNMRYTNFHVDEELNVMLNNYKLLDENEKEIINILDESLESVLYSKYYWFSRYKTCYNKLYQQDEGIEQQQFKIIEEIEYRLIKGVDWEIIQQLEEGT